MPSPYCLTSLPEGNGFSDPERPRKRIRAASDNVAEDADQAPDAERDRSDATSPDELQLPSTDAYAKFEDVSLDWGPPLTTKSGQHPRFRTMVAPSPFQALQHSTSGTMAASPPPSPPLDPTSQTMDAVMRASIAADMARTACKAAQTACEDAADAERETVELAVSAANHAASALSAAADAERARASFLASQL